MTAYPELETFMGAWFHQDFDINGQTIDEIVAAYREVTPHDQQQALIRDIKAFIARSPDVDRAFQDQFRPEIIPTTFAPTTRAFLEQIVTSLIQ